MCYALGQKLGVLGKEGGSGGWSHLHFDIWARQPSGLWGIEEGYAFLWQAYEQEHSRELIAVARRAPVGGPEGYAGRFALPRTGSSL